MNTKNKDIKFSIFEPSLEILVPEVEVVEEKSSSNEKGEPAVGDRNDYLKGSRL